MDVHMAISSREIRGYFINLEMQAGPWLLLFADPEKGVHHVMNDKRVIEDRSKLQPARK
jgi:hypothetical protein